MKRIIEFINFLEDLRKEDANIDINEKLGLTANEIQKIWRKHFDHTSPSWTNLVKIGIIEKIRTSQHTYFRAR